MLERLDLDTEKPTEEELARKFGFEEDYFKGTVSWWQTMKPQIWSLFDEPYSSNSAKVRTRKGSPGDQVLRGEMGNLQSFGRESEIRKPTRKSE